MASITLEQVRKIYDGNVVALEDMSLEITDGEFVVFVGPSGCGKSTALKMIAGLEEVSSGRIRIGGKDVTDAAPKHRDIAMVFQNYALYPHLTVGRNIGFPLKMRHAPPAEIAAKVKAAAKVLGIEALLDRRPRQLSGGQRQRVALGRAIVREPQAFLMDEPLSNLDAKLRVQMRAEIGALHDRLGVTTIYVTHDQVEAMTMADRIVIMRDGVIQQVAEPDDMYAHPANVFVAGFIGSPAMNFFHATLEPLDGGYAVSLGTSRLPVPIEASAGRTRQGQEVIVGLRPEHIGNVAEGGTPLSVTPTLVESLGGERYVHFALPAANQVALASARGEESSGDTMIARIVGQRRPRAGEPISLAVDTSQLRLFDPKTEQALQEPRQQP